MATFISFILDETGSMMSCKDATISGFNEYIQTLQKDGKGVRFTLTKFNSDKTEVVLDAVKMADVPLLTDKTYQPSAMTPLYDAIGRTIRSLEKVVDGKKKTKVLVAIQTDGQENSSKEYNLQAIVSMIAEKKKDGWTFVFMGADIDAYAVANSIGVPKGNTLSYDSSQSQAAFSVAASNTSRHLRSATVQTSTFFSEPDEDKG